MKDRADFVPASMAEGSGVDRADGVGRPHLYEIPIMLRRSPPRKPMRRMAPLHPAGKGHRSLPRSLASIPGLADTAQEQRMLDAFMVALGLGFFVAAVGYAYACERL